jgi:hypothetical protein
MTGGKIRAFTAPSDDDWALYIDRSMNGAAVQNGQAPAH